MSHEEGVAKVAELIKDIRIAMLTTSDDDGHLVSRPMAVQEVEFDGDLWFVSSTAAPKVSQIQHESRVNVAFSSASSWVSVSGTATLVNDVAKAKELWNPAIEAWFPDGPEAPGTILVRVRTDGAEYWDTPGGKVMTAISYVKAKATGQRYDGGENEVVEL